MHRLDDVLAGRQPVQLEAAIIAGHREERVVDNADVRRHPRMDVALDANQHLGRRELAHRGHALGRHADVEAL